MSEEIAAEQAPDTGGLALDLAMEEARSNPSLQGSAAAFLRSLANALVGNQYPTHIVL